MAKIGDLSIKVEVSCKGWIGVRNDNSYTTTYSIIFPTISLPFNFLR